MKNQELARLFDRIADALELKGETGFRVLAYRKAARVLAELTEDVATLDAEGRLQTVPGIGAGIAKKIHEYLTTGKMKKFQEVTSGLPQGLFALLDIPGLGPKTVKLLHEQLGVSDRNGLKRVIADGSFAKLPGLGAKKAENILKGMAMTERSGDRMYLSEALELAEGVVRFLTEEPHVKRATYAGSLRRGKETIGDIDILATGHDAQAIIKRFLSHPQVRQVTSAGDTKASALFETETGLRQVDIRVVADEDYGAALQYFTGSKDHNVALRQLAQKKGLKVSEYGVFRGNRKIAGRSEPAVYRALGFPYIEPELREDRGELAAAQAGKLPRLVELADIRSDLHIHTDSSDGTASFDQIVAAAQVRGYTHIAITEHSASAHYAGGLSADALLRRCDQIDRFNERSLEFRVLKSSEVDITPEGELDYPDRVLARLDLVIASIHQAFRHEATKRMCAALAHPLVHIIAHPSGRIIGKREGYDIDLEKVIECAARYGKILEINAYYGRLDLNDVWARKAKEAGVKLAINTDAHGTLDLDWMRYGVVTARRAWLEKKDVVNCLTYDQLQRLLRSMTTPG